jgi:hypothetical protein
MVEAFCDPRTAGPHSTPRVRNAHGAGIRECFAFSLNARTVRVHSGATPLAGAGSASRLPLALRRSAFSTKRVGATRFRDPGRVAPKASERCN